MWRGNFSNRCHLNQSNVTFFAKIYILLLLLKCDNTVFEHRMLYSYPWVIILLQSSQITFTTTRVSIYTQSTEKCMHALLTWHDASCSKTEQRSHLSSVWARCIIFNITLSEHVCSSNKSWTTSNSAWNMSQVTLVSIVRMHSLYYAITT